MLGNHKYFVFKKHTEGTRDYPYTQPPKQRAVLETYLPLETSSEFHNAKFISYLNTIAKHESSIVKLFANLKALDGKLCAIATELKD